MRNTILLSCVVWTLAVIISIMLAQSFAFCDTQSYAQLPAGVKAVWDVNKAFHEVTPTRERICLNGLWLWQPAVDTTDAVPTGRWGCFKVPGSWPGVTDYMQKDCQTVFVHPEWKNKDIGGITMAWYQRKFTVPTTWTGRRIKVQTDYVNSFAVFYVDDVKAGEIRFPSGEVDITELCKPGATHTLSILVTAMPLKAVMMSYTDTASARLVTGTVPRRGLCGDVYLVGTAAGPHISGLALDTSYRKRDITFVAAMTGLDANAQYTLHAQINDKDKKVTEFTSQPFKGSDLVDERMAFTSKWMPEKLWDLNTPGNVYEVQLTLLNASGMVLDTSWKSRFGFREFWIVGRDFYLNGTRIFLSAVPLDNASIGAGWASYKGARETMLRLKKIGISFVYTHNYDCEPGSHLSFAEVLRAADDVGMLVSLTQPHFSNYEWSSPDADKTNGYAMHAAFYVRMAENHPSVVTYAMSHNATGYSEDMNPDMMDGIQNPRDQWSANNVKLALRAEAIVKKLDPTRIVYHHSSGNLGSMHTTNFYINFTQIQEVSDWFEHWATKGVKPLFTCEYGVPFTWDWAMYRGWYKGQREWGSANVPWEFCMAEWNSQFVGDIAFRISEAEKTDLRWEAKKFRVGGLWHRWDYPVEISSPRFLERYPIIAKYITDNWRAFRTWGLSANSPWEYGSYWVLRDGVNKGRKELPVDWDSLQRPGFSPDYIDQQYERMDIAYEEKDWIPTPAADALIRNNAPLLAYIGGKSNAFTSKDHDFLLGEALEKQLIIINNSRQNVNCACAWSLSTPIGMKGQQQIKLGTGQQKLIPLRFQLPVNLPAGNYKLSAQVAFSDGQKQSDSFTIHVLPLSKPAQSSAKIAVFDPAGETTRLLKRLAVTCKAVNAGDDLSRYDVLIVGKTALTRDGRAPAITRLHDGLKVIVFEQTSQVLEKRFGFRVTEYGLRTVFKRVPDHTLLAGLTEDNLRDWRGSATILSPRLKYEMRPMYGPTIKWCDIEVTRPWRSGNRGNVASVLIEKPARGDFMPIIDGGYSLQYSPLMEYREGKGLMLFCQVDVTARTETDPAADILVRNILRYVSTWKPTAHRTVVYSGDPAGKRYLESEGITTTIYNGEKLNVGQALVVGPGGGSALEKSASAISSWLKEGGHMLAIGLNEQEANAFMPVKVNMKSAEHISSYFEPFGVGSPMAGIASADAHNRDPREMPLINGGATVIGDGVLAKAIGRNIVFCQIAPWQFENSKQLNLRRTFRRTAYLVNRLLCNMGCAGSTPIASRFSSPLTAVSTEKRWLDGIYLDTPIEWDDPYRFFGW